MGIRANLGILMAAVLIPAMAGAGQERKKASRIEGEYHVMVGGQEIGVEKYVIILSAEGVSSSSTIQFRSPIGARQKVALETRLEANAAFTPHSYELKSDVDGKKGSIQGSFTPNEVIFAYAGAGLSSRDGLLVGERYTILDTNVFHHFIFLTRLFTYGSPEKSQQFEVIIPQEKENGTLKVTEVGMERIQVKGKTINADHLKIETGMVTIHLWVDSDHIPRKISLPDKDIEVISG